MSDCTCDTCALKRRVSRLEAEVERLAALVASSTHTPKPTIDADRIARFCASEWGIPVAWIAGPQRGTLAGQARQATFLFCREHLGYSYPQIGDAFGRDHSTVMAALEVFGRRLARDGYLRVRVQLVATRLGIPCPESARDREAEAAC